MSLQIQNLSPDSAYVEVTKRNRWGQTSEQPTLKLAKHIGKNLSEKAGAMVLGFIVFGSVASGSQTKTSDLDLFLLVQDRYPALQDDIESSTEAAGNQEIVVTVALPEELFTALNTQDPFLFSILETGKILIDNWYLDSLKQAVAQSRTPASKLTAQFLLERAESRLHNVQDDINYVKKRLLACSVDIGSALCHFEGKVAFSEEEILETLRGKEEIPKSFIDSLEAKINSKPGDEKLNELLVQTEQFIEEAQRLTKNWRTSSESTN